MPQRSEPNSRTGRPPVTSRAAILAGALRVIETDGWEKLTVRRLATELGVGTTTLYHHVRDKEDLLVQLLNDHVEQRVHVELPDDPRGRLLAAAEAIHDALAAWPWAAEILTADGFFARLGVSAQALVEVAVDAAIDAGCTPEQAVDVFRNLWYYTVGEILVRARSTRHSAPADERERLFGDIDAERLPRLAEIGGRWPKLAARDIYPEGLEAFVDGLLARAAAGGR